MSILLKYLSVSIISHALLGSCAVGLLHVGADNVGVLEHAVVDGGERVIVGHFAGGRVSA